MAADETSPHNFPLLMNVATLQRIDRRLGIPLCFCLTRFRRWFGRRQHPSPPSLRRILFVKLAEQGSTVLAYPAIRRAVEMAGRENVYFIVFEENRFILDALGLVPEANVITLSFASFFSMCRTAVQAVARMRKLKLDGAIDMEFFSRGSAAITFLSGARTRVGFHTFFGEGPYRGDLMTHRLLYNPYLHTAQTFQALVEALTQKPGTLPAFGSQPPVPDERLPEFSPSPHDRAAMQTLLRELSGTTARAPFILLNPNASDLVPLRRWPNPRYLELAGRLLERFPEAHVAFTGMAAEADAIEEMTRAVGSPRCFSLAGKTTLPQLMALYTLADVLVTNDSGPAHFASLTPIRVVALFGPETPALYAARNRRNTALWAGLVCSPCVNAYNNRQSPCQDNLCMQQISVDQVFAAVCSACTARAAAKA